MAARSRRTLLIAATARNPRGADGALQLLNAISHASGLSTTGSIRRRAESLGVTIRTAAGDPRAKQFDTPVGERLLWRGAARQQFIEHPQGWWTRCEGHSLPARQPR